MAETTKHVVAIMGGKGGVGKSVISLCLAVGLEARGWRIGLLDGDLYGPDIPRMVGLTRSATADFVTLWRNPNSSRRRLQPVERYGIQLLSSQFFISEEQSIGFHGSLALLLLERMLNAEWDGLDLLVIDLPPGTSDIQQRLPSLVALDAAILVVTPQDVSHLDARKVLDLLRRQQVRVLGGVENMSYFVCEHCSHVNHFFPAVVEGRSIWTQIPKLVDVPFDAALASALERGQSIHEAALSVGVAGALDALVDAVEKSVLQPRT